MATLISCGQRHREYIEIDRSALDPKTGEVHGTATLSVPNTSASATWQTVPVSLTMAVGTNLIVCSVDSADEGGINLDYIALA